MPLTDISPLNECLVCEIKVNKSKYFLTCIYRSPNQSSEQISVFCSGLETTFNNIILESPTCSFVIGDFNAKCSMWWFDGISNLCGLELNDLCSIFGHSQIINKPTNFEPNKRRDKVLGILAHQKIDTCQNISQ